MYVYTCVYVYVCICKQIILNTLCMYVCMYVCVYVNRFTRKTDPVFSLSVCMYVYVCVCICKQIILNTLCMHICPNPCAHQHTQTEMNSAILWCTRIQGCRNNGIPCFASQQAIHQDHQSQTTTAPSRA
jgi:hypothetical protein